MPLSPGHRLGPYEVISPLGAGGMGEVYKARDTRLQRTVAIKVLPPHFRDDGELRQRFHREAEAIAALNHPNICTLFDVSQEDGLDFLVMEYLDGQTLGERLASGRMPLAEALRVGIDVAGALDVAHRHGIVHRDLKPSNVMLTGQGIKLLDFGLAKLAARKQVETEATRTTPLTEKGAMLGTLQYMAPEQLEGQEADARSDVFGLGAILYETLTGRRPFEGRSAASIIAAILTSEPPAPSSLAPVLTPQLDSVVQRCLAKNPDERWQSARDVAFALQMSAPPHGVAPAGAAPAPPAWRRSLWPAAVIGLAAALALAVLVLRTPAGPQPTIIASMPPPPGTTYAFGGVGGLVSLSPDGTAVVFAAVTRNVRSLWLRRLDEPEVRQRQLPGTERGSYPFWSPDGRYVAFFADGKLKKVGVSGGPPVDICPALDGRGGTWNAHGDIVFALRFSPLFRISASGGTPVAITRTDAQETSHRWPHFLPDGRRYMYLASPRGSANEGNTIKVASLDGGAPKDVLRVSSQPVFSKGHLLYVRDRVLLAQPFDLERLTLTGEAVPVADPVRSDSIFSFGFFSASPNGVLMYQSGTERAAARLVWYDPSGAIGDSVGEVQPYLSVRISPDGRRVAASIAELPRNVSAVWIYDLARGAETRLSTVGQLPRVAVPLSWSPDGRRLALPIARNDVAQVHEQGVSGGDSKLLLAEDNVVNIPIDWTSDGRHIVVRRVPLSQSRLSDLYVLPATGEGKPVPLRVTPGNDVDARVSADSRWFAYATDESGRYEVHACTFPACEKGVQVSTTGGFLPTWRPDKAGVRGRDAEGGEIYYLTLDGVLMAVPVKVIAGALEPGVPRRVLQVELTLSPSYDVAPDGRLLFVVPAAQQTPEAVTLALNWPGLLRK